MAKKIFDLAIDNRLNTYACRADLKQIGCKWNADVAAWMACDEVMWARGMEIARGAGPKRDTPVRRPTAQRAGDGVTTCICCRGRLSSFDLRAASIRGYHFDCAP